MKRVAVKIAYFGDEFAGSQIQPGLRTVEGDALTDLKKIGTLGDNAIDLKAASRTDRGVNAIGNVIVFNTAFDDNAALLKALNAVSKGVFYRSIADVGKGFNPRHAKERVYRYILPSFGMDADSVRECASLFVGTHDFARFCKHDDRNTVIDMRSVTVDEDIGIFILEFRSEYFLWNQIRRMVAAISSVGWGDSGIRDVERALRGRDVSFGVARPDALTLMDIVYDNVSFVPAESLGPRAGEKRFELILRNMFLDSL